MQCSGNWCHMYIILLESAQCREVKHQRVGLLDGWVIKGLEQGRLCICNGYINDIKKINCGSFLFSLKTAISYRGRHKNICS